MTASDEWRCSAATVAPGHTATFRLAHDGRSVSGFVVNHGGQYRAYVNTCPHIGTPLDLWPNEFYDDAGRDLICSTHGALFDPLSGRCIAGPCMGDHLTALPLTLEGDTLIVRLPESPPRG